MSEELRNIILDNLEFFQQDKRKSFLKITKNLQALNGTVDNISAVIGKITNFASDYDLDAATPANGYRSWLYISGLALQQTETVSKSVKENRGKIFFRVSFYEKEIESFNALLQSLFVIGCSLVENHNESAGSKSLLSNEGIYENKISKTMDAINLETFYGRNFGFHLSQPLRLLNKFPAVLMAAYSEYYYSNQHMLIKLIRMPHTYLKYLFNSKLLSQKIVELFGNADVDYNKSLLLLGETRIYRMFQGVVEPKVSVNRALNIQPEPLEIFSEKNGKLIDIPVPSSHIGAKPIKCRLISARKRKGMTNVKAKGNADEPSKYLIIDAHGGGWITQDSRFHGSYLRKWAATLDVPILGIDYSLAPEAPFPRAVEEVFYAYCWALKNSELLGSTGENIVLVGDSAGANVNTACVIKCIEMGIRIPKGILDIYPVFLSNYVMAPSRFLGLMDVILPYKTHMRLFKAYNGIFSLKSSENREIPKAPVDEFDAPLSKNYLISPHLAPDDVLRQFPVTHILSTDLDPCLDDCVEFAKKLKKLEVAVELDVLPELNHGFLYFAQMSKKCHGGSKVCMSRIAEILELNNRSK